MCIDKDKKAIIHIKDFHKRLLNNNDRICLEYIGLKLPFYYIGRYLPKSRFPNQNDYSNKIVSFKSGDSRSILTFSIATTAIVLVLTEKYHKLFIPDIVIPIPSSTSNKVSEGHKYLCEYLSKRLDILNGTGYLIRVREVKPAHLSKDRPTFYEHYRTIDCVGDVANKKVLLFDDIYTTGSTACACMLKLIDNDVKRVSLITLGRTIDR